MKIDTLLTEIANSYFFLATFGRTRLQNTLNYEQKKKALFPFRGRNTTILV